MAAGGRRGGEELPVYLARPGTAAVPRQKRGGLFCSVEGAFESKTLDFGALRVGQRRAPPPARPEPGPEPGSAPGPGSDAAEERLQDLPPADDKVGAGSARRGRGAAPGPRRGDSGRGGAAAPVPGAGRSRRSRGVCGGEGGRLCWPGVRDPARGAGRWRRHNQSALTALPGLVKPSARAADLVTTVALFVPV